MINSYKRVLLVIFMISLFFISNSAQAQVQTSTSTITDTTNDVTMVQTKQGNSGVPNIYTETVTTQPNIDIVSAAYTPNDNGSVSISLTVKGKIESDNQTYYNIQLIGNYLSTTRAYTFKINLYYTTLFSIATNSIIPNVQYDYRNGSQSGYGPMNSYAHGSILTVTLEPNITSSTNNNFTVTLPRSFPENQVNNYFNTTWHIITFHGNSTIPDDPYGGNQYFDYYPNSDNQYLIGITHLSPAPGFEVFSILAIPAIIAIKRKLNP